MNILFHRKRGVQRIYLLYRRSSRKCNSVSGSVYLFPDYPNLLQILMIYRSFCILFYLLLLLMYLQAFQPVSLHKEVQDPGRIVLLHANPGIIPQLIRLLLRLLLKQPTCSLKKMQGISYRLYKEISPVLYRLIGGFLQTGCYPLY